MDTGTVAEIKQIIENELPGWIEQEPGFQRRLLQALSEGTTPGPLRMTYEEFLAWADEDTLAEWVEGEVIMTSPASLQHQLIAGFLSAVMGIYAQGRQLGVVVTGPFQMKLRNGREPDLIFVATDHLGRFKENRLEGAADLVVEIISPESVDRDRGRKFYEYEQGGILEYWLIDPLRRWVDIYVLEEDRYRPAFSGATGRYDSRALTGFWLDVDWLWQRPLPTPLRALGEIVRADPDLVAAVEQATGGRRAADH